MNHKDVLIGGFMHGDSAWVFKWMKTIPNGEPAYVTSWLGASKRGVINNAVKFHKEGTESRAQTWAKVRREGGRVVKVKLVEQS
jgi:hypothetical protein